MGGIYILKNDLLLLNLKNLILSLMSLQAEMRGEEKRKVGEAIDSIKKAMEMLK